MVIIDEKIKSTVDGSYEKAFFIPSKDKNAPLIVKLHTWSAHKENENNIIKEIYK